MSASKYTRLLTPILSRDHKDNLVNWSAKWLFTPLPPFGGAMRATGTGSHPEDVARHRAFGVTTEGKYRTMRRAVVFVFWRECPRVATAAAYPSL